MAPKIKAPKCTKILLEGGTSDTDHKFLDIAPTMQSITHEGRRYTRCKQSQGQDPADGQWGMMYLWDGWGTWKREQIEQSRTPAEVTFTIELACVESVIEQECAVKEFTQKDLALTYAMGLLSTWPTDWKRANAAILARWPKGLSRVKELAWKLAEEKRAGKSELADAIFAAANKRAVRQFAAEASA